MSRVTNALVDVRFTLNIPPEKINMIIGEDDGTEAWFGSAWDKLDAHFKDNWQEYMDHMHNGEAETEVTI